MRSRYQSHITKSINEDNSAVHFITRQIWEDGRVYICDDGESHKSRKQLRRELRLAWGKSIKIQG